MTLMWNIEKDASGQPIAGKRVTISLLSGEQPAYSDNQLSIESVGEILTDENGRWELDLEPNVDLVPAGTVYSALLRFRGGNYAHLFTTPDAPGLNWIGDNLSEIPGDLPSGALGGHLADTTAHLASAVVVSPIGGLVATNAQSALAEIDLELSQEVTNRINDVNSEEARALAAEANLAATKQPLDSDLTAIAALSTTPFGRNLLALADGAALAGSIPNGTYAGTPLGAAATAVVYAPPPTGVAATDVAAAQALLDALPATGGTVRLREITAGGVAYNLGTVGLHVKPKCRLMGEGSFGSRVDYSGTGFAITVGNLAFGAALAYGCAVENVRVICTANAGSAIELRETVMASVVNVQIEGPPSSTTGIGVQVNGGDTANIFTYLCNVLVTHIKFPHRWVTTGTTPCTSITAVNCTGFADSIAGSIGLDVAASCGQGSRWYGGNLENCATGVSIAGPGVLVNGCRFESNTLDVLFAAGAKSNVVTDGFDLATITDSSGNLTNKVSGRSTITGASKSLRTGETVYLAAPVNKLSIGPDSVLNGQNGVYQDVDVSANIAPGATAALIALKLRDSVVGEGAYVRLRGKGITTGGQPNDGSVGQFVAHSYYNTQQIQVPVDSAGVFQYQPAGFNAGAGELYLDVLGYVV